MLDKAILIIGLLIVCPFAFGVGISRDGQNCLTNYKLDFTVDGTNDKFVTEFMGSAQSRPTGITIIHQAEEWGVARPIHFSMQVNGVSNPAGPRACSVKGDILLDFDLIGRESIGVDSTNCDFFDSVLALSEKVGVSTTQCK